MMHTDTSSLFVGWKLPFDEDLFERLMGDQEIPFDCVVDKINASYILIGEYVVDNLSFTVVPTYEPEQFDQWLQTYKQTLIAEYGDSFEKLFPEAQSGSFVLRSGVVAF